MSDINNNKLDYYYNENIKMEGITRDKLSLNDEMDLYYSNSNSSQPKIGGATGSIFITNGNSVNTIVSGDVQTFINANVDNLGAVVEEYGKDWEAVGNTFSLKYTGDIQDCKVNISGTIIAINPSFLGANIGVKVHSSTQRVFTGGIKFFPVGVSFGSSLQLGYDITIYGRFIKDDIIDLQLSSTEAGGLILTDSIIFLEHIQAAT